MKTQTLEQKLEAAIKFAEALAAKNAVGTRVYAVALENIDRLQEQLDNQNSDED